MDDVQAISIMELIWRKTQGCYREFGFREIFRRFIRESLRAMGKSKNPVDISSVIEEFSIGAAPKSTDGVRHLRKLGFSHLIDLRAERRKTDILAKTKEISVHWVPTYDDWRPKPTEFFSKLETVIKKILLSNGNARFLLCCAAGEHRAPLAGVLALVLMGYSLDKAVKTIGKARPAAELLPSYQSSLSEFVHTKLAHRGSRENTPNSAL